MPDLRLLSAAALVALTAIPTAAQQPSDSVAVRIERALRMPAHRMLMRSIEGATLSEFATDGCSGGLSTAWEIVSGLLPGFASAQGSPPWEICCEAHDLTYHDAGGAATAEESYAARLAADQGLRQCVVVTGTARAPDIAAQYDVTAEQVIAAYATAAEAMYDAVRAGGAPCSGMTWRWGYGYPDCHPVFR